MTEDWLIWSNYHLAWWKENGMGYTMDIKEAGRYTLIRARGWAAMRSPMVENGEKYPAELIVPSPEYQEKLLKENL